MGLFKKLFRRKKASTVEGDGVAAPHSPTTAGEKTRQKPVEPARVMPQPTTPPQQKHNRKSDVGPDNHAPERMQKGAAPNGSYPSNAATGSRSMHTPRERDVDAMAGRFPGQSQSDHVRVLSPRNQGGAQIQNTGSPSNKYQITPVRHDENLNHSSSAGSSVSPHLSHQHLQQLDLQNVRRSPPPAVSGPGHSMYTMSTDIPRGQLQAMDEMNRSDASSSSFNLSTDAEDSEYETLRRLGVIPRSSRTRGDNSVMSAISGPMYNTEDERLFPALNTDDDMTTATSQSGQDATSAMHLHRLGMNTKPYTAPLRDDEPHRTNLYAQPPPPKQKQAPVFAMNAETDDDLRAWGVSPSTTSNKDPSSAKSSNTPNHMFSFDNSSTPQSSVDNNFTPRSSGPVDPPASTNSRSTGPRNFTSPASRASSSNSGFSPDPDFATFVDFNSFGNNAFASQKAEPRENAFTSHKAETRENAFASHKAETRENAFASHKAETRENAFTSRKAEPRENALTNHKVETRENAFAGHKAETRENTTAWRDEKKTQEFLPAKHTPPREFKEMERSFEVAPTRETIPATTSQYAHSSPGGPDTSLSELLAQAKNKQRRGARTHRSSRASTSSVNSAPAITASFLRQHHNLGRFSTGTPATNTMSGNDRSPNEGASVSDIIQSLEATNQSRLTTGSRASYGHRSVGEIGAVSTARAVKERLREKRRKEREMSSGFQNGPSSEGSSTDNSDNEASESWLFDEVTGALGPRGIAADLESLSGRSNRSKNSNGNKSHKSHKSRSRRSRHSGTTRRHKSSSGDSVDSRTSRNSRYSHRSTKSFLSQMSEQSRSVANDLLRLEMQLAMVGSNDNRDDIPSRVGGGSVGGTSVGASSRVSRSGARKPSTSQYRSSPTNGQVPAISAATRRTKITVLAPPGKLGIILANKADSKGTVVSGVRTSSVLAEKISPGDRIVAIDGEDVSRMTVSEITTIMSRKADYDRTLTVLTVPKQIEPYGQSGSSTSPANQSSYNGHAVAVSPAKGKTVTDSYETSFGQFRR